MSSQLRNITRKLLIIDHYTYEQEKKLMRKNEKFPSLERKKEVKEK